MKLEELCTALDQAILDRDGLNYIDDISYAVRAILDRLREPSAGMIAAGERALVGQSNDHWGRAATAYQAMLSAIDEKEVR